jgi:predicted MFS family arabinose efflux permease
MADVPADSGHDTRQFLATTLGGNLGSEALHNRWGILAVLFVVRATMAFQFQSVAAVAPLLGKAFGVSIADIGVLIGLFFAPGIALALPGGAIGRKFGDKRTVLGALALMLAGSLAMALAASWSFQIAGRLVAGAGALAKWTRSAATAFDFGAAAILSCPLLLWGFNRIAAARPQAAVNAHT